MFFMLHSITGYCSFTTVGTSTTFMIFLLLNLVSKRNNIVLFFIIITLHL